jgi:hypothetical protein
MRQFYELQKRNERHVRTQNIRAGVIAAAAGNFSMGKDPNKPPLEWDDFFVNNEKSEKIIDLSPEQTLIYLQAVFGSKTN